MLLVGLGQAGFMRLTLLPQSILHPVGNVILESMNVALQHTTCQLHALNCALAGMTGVNMWVISVGEPYGIIQNEDYACI